MESYPDLSPGRILGIEQIDLVYDAIVQLNEIKTKIEEIDSMSTCDLPKDINDQKSELLFTQLTKSLEAREKFLQLELPDKERFITYAALEHSVAEDIGIEDDIDIATFQYLSLIEGSAVIFDPKNYFICGVVDGEPKLTIKKCQDNKQGSFGSGLSLAFSLIIPINSDRIIHKVEVNKEQLQDMLIGSSAINNYFDWLFKNADRQHEALDLATFLRDSIGTIYEPKDKSDSLIGPIKVLM